MQSIDFEGEVRKIVEKDNRFDPEAYIFLKDALDYCQKMSLKAGRGVMGAGKHVTVAELLEGIRDYALREYGPMAITLLDSWGVRKCEHFGDMVFNLVEIGVFRTTENDKREDFMKGFDFNEAFVAPFKPGKKQSTAEPSAK